MNLNQNIAQQLRGLSDKEFCGAKSFVEKLDVISRTAFFIEVCRTMDYQHVLQIFSENPANKMNIPDFEIMVRGWNSALGLLLAEEGDFVGIPISESTQESRGHAVTFLHQLGRCYYLRHAADMIHNGMAQAKDNNGEIEFEMGPNGVTDHFLDHLELDKLRKLDSKITGADPAKEFREMYKIPDLAEKMKALVFPWPTSRGVMIGYDAEPDIDLHYMAEVAQETMDWRAEAGIHPEAKVSGVYGKDICAIGLLLTSIYLKHIHFIDIGKKKIPDANFAMSLTIWKTDGELSRSISEFLKVPVDGVAKALELFIVRPKHVKYFQTNTTPFIPLLIQVSNGYLLAPVSSIFRNPLNGIRRLQEFCVEEKEDSVQDHREEWMISELTAIFMGTRYVVIDSPTKLKRGKDVVTDIDAAILDVTTGELALFQLKWQDFDINNVKKLRSRAKNFIEQIDDWTERVEAWIAEFGLKALVSLFHFKAVSAERITAVRLFAIGRNAARFKSYGYIPNNKELAVASWAQFVRIRYEIGPAQNVFQSLKSKIMQENSFSPKVQPIRYEMTTGGIKVVFKNLWNNIEDEQD